MGSLVANLADLESIGQNLYSEISCGRLLLHGVANEGWEMNKDDNFVHRYMVVDEPNKNLVVMDL